MSVGLKSKRVELPVESGMWELFEQSLRAAIRDIDEHPRGELFRRMIEFGPLSVQEQAAEGDDGGVLSDDECGQSVEFIRSHMVSRFQGELAELLAIEPCAKLAEDLVSSGRLPASVRLIWGGGSIRERRRLGTTGGEVRWGSFAKGADGLLAVASDSGSDCLDVYGLVEVKSTPRSTREIVEQLDGQIERLAGGVRLGDREYSSVHIRGKVSRGGPIPVRIIVVPSAWRLNRERTPATTVRQPRAATRSDLPRGNNRVTELDAGLWKVTLAWSQEALARAAYEMTFWYMAQVGERVYANGSPWSGENGMTPQEAGRNSIKMMLYFILLRPLSERHHRIATKLYNVYCFGYPNGIDSREMLWPDDFPTES